MKMKPIGKAKLAYDRGRRDRRQGKNREENPYTLFGSANDMQASWWVTGWQEEIGCPVVLDEISKKSAKKLKRENITRSVEESIKTLKS